MTDTWLVTGGAGFIGRVVVEQLLAWTEGPQVVVLDAMTYAAHPVALRAVGESYAGLPESSRLTIVEGDVADGVLVSKLMARVRPRVVLNLAAETHVDRSLSNNAPFVRTNVEGTEMLVRASVDCRVERFVQVSTDEVYGDRVGRRAARETDGVEPTNPYAATKACGDALVQAAVRSSGLDAVITRGCNTYGPGQFPEKLLPLAALRWGADQPMWVYGDGLQERVWLHVDDHAAGILAAARVGTEGAVYHFSGGRPRTNQATLESWRRALGLGGRPDDYLRGDSSQLIKFVPDRPGHDRRYALGDQETRRQLGWAPRRSWRSGLRATAKWLASNPQFWASSLEQHGVSAFFAAQYGEPPVVAS